MYHKYSLLGSPDILCEQGLAPLNPDPFHIGDTETASDQFENIPLIIKRAGLTAQFADTIASLQTEITQASGGEHAERERQRRARRNINWSSSLLILISPLPFSSLCS